MKKLFAAVLVLVLGVLAAGCGVDFRSAKLGNEFFVSAAVTGDLHAGSPLSGNVAFKQNYATEVTVVCELRQGKNKVQDIGHEAVPPLPNGTPEKTPFPGNYSWTFTVANPGTYKFECFTPADQDNYIIDQFTVTKPLDVQPTKLPATPE